MACDPPKQSVRQEPLSNSRALSEPHNLLVMWSGKKMDVLNKRPRREMIVAIFARHDRQCQFINVRLNRDHSHNHHARRSGPVVRLMWSVVVRQILDAQRK